MIPINLNPGEQIILRQRIHLGALAFSLIPIGGLLVPAILADYALAHFAKMLSGLGGGGNAVHTSSFLATFWTITAILTILVFGVILLAYWQSDIILSNKRLIWREGILDRSSGELPLENLDIIVVHEPLLGRVIGFGTIQVSSLGGLKVDLPYIGAPLAFHAALQKAVDSVKAPKLPPKPPVPPLDDSRYMPKF